LRIWKAVPSASAFRADNAGALLANGLLLPSRFALQLAAAWLVVGVGAALAGAVEPWLYAGGVLLGAMLTDAVWLSRRPRPSAERRVAAALAVGRWHDVTLRIASTAPDALRVEIRDHVPVHFHTRALPLHHVLPARGWIETSYAIRPTTRGAFEFQPLALRLRTRLGLMERQLRAADAQAVRVYPDFGALSGYALLATDHRLSQMGILQRRRRGEGMDFQQLREYRRGDSLRRIDWKATARMHRLISREYQDERDQAIVIVLDCGRRMGAADGEMSHFDRALNAALLLAHVGLSHGDAVGVLTMAGDSRFIAPRKARSTTTLMLNLLYDLQPTLHTSDYYAAALDVMRRVHRRALVVVISNLRDEDDDTLMPALGLLRRRHLVLFASLRETVLGSTLSAPVRDLDDALTHAATADYLHARQAAFNRLERAGAMLIDVEPQDLPLALVNRYLEVKGSGVL
jgi:uncharacterized protein (DUF58 family)